MRRSFLVLSILTALFSQAQVDTITQRIFLIGDGGELINGKHPVTDWLQKNVNWNDERNSAIFLGDNIYPLGLPMKGAPSYEEAKKILAKYHGNDDANAALVKLEWKEYQEAVRLDASDKRW